MSETVPAPSLEPVSPTTARRAVWVCLAALILYASLAWFAVRTKSPIYDEPLHAVGAWTHLYMLDFRVNPEDPPLWHYWAALPQGADALKPEAHAQTFAEVLEDTFFEWKFVFQSLYSTPGVDAHAFIARSRAMMLMVGIALGATVVGWAWKLAGPIAAMGAAVLFAFDPNFLGHGPIIKNDVAMSLATLAVAMAVWHAGKRITPWNVLAIALLCAAGVLAKFSGILLGPIVATMLIARALLPTPWPVFAKALTTRSTRLLAAFAICCIAGVVTYVGIWAGYGFRYAPTPLENVGLNTNQLVDQVRANQVHAETSPRIPTYEELEAWRPDAFLSAVLFAETHRLLPHAYTTGLVFTYQSTFYHNAFLLGEYSWTGWWYYFPVALVLKSSLSLWLAAIASIYVAFRVYRARGASLANVATSPATWTTLCLLIPPLLYLLSAMRTNLNIGVRHVFPVIPFILLAVAIAAAYAWRHWSKRARTVALVLAAGLAIEAAIAFPNYIAFFNIALGGPRGGLHLLGDSNLDWGQDLPALARWQEKNPDRALYRLYFGTAPPEAYGIESRKIPPVPSMERAVIAISATELQGIYLYHDRAQLKHYVELIQETCPLIDVLGGTIYLFDYDPLRPRR